MKRRRFLQAVAGALIGLNLNLGFARADGVLRPVTQSNLNAVDFDPEAFLAYARKLGRLGAARLDREVREVLR